IPPIFAEPTQRFDSERRINAVVAPTLHSLGAGEGKMAAIILRPRTPLDGRGAMNAKCVRMLLIAWPGVACLWLAAFPPIPAKASKPPATLPDIQGTWDLVSWEKNGKSLERKNVQFFITESHIYADGVPLPDDAGFKSHSYDLGPGDKPNVA